MKFRLFSHPRPSQAGFLTLIGLLLVIVIIGILAASMFGGGSPLSPGGGSPAMRDLLGPSSSEGPQSVYGKTVQMAKGTVDKNNLSQARLAIQMFVGNQGRYPASLQELLQATPGLVLTCAETKQPYSYDPNTGRIWCAQPGHARY